MMEIMGVKVVVDQAINGPIARMQVEDESLQRVSTDLSIKLTELILGSVEKLAIEKLSLEALVKLNHLTLTELHRRRHSGNVG
jgi:hypothetical protein